MKYEKFYCPLTSNLSVDFGDGIVIKDLGYERTLPSHTFGPSARDYYLIHIVVGGRGTFTREGKTYSLSSGEAFLIRPFEVTLYSSDKSEPWEYYWMGFSGDKAKALIDYAFPSDKCVASVGKGTISTINSLFSTVMSGEIDQLKVRSAIYRLLSSVRRSLVQSDAHALGIVEQALNYFEINYYRSLSISELAFELGVTRAYFTTLFTQEVGDSPYNYLTKLRMEKAKQLMSKGEKLSISEIAYSVGFTSLERFSEMFKKHEGVSPKAYQRSIYKV